MPFRTVLCPDHGKDTVEAAPEPESGGHMGSDVKTHLETDTHTVLDVNIGMNLTTRSAYAWAAVALPLARTCWPRSSLHGFPFPP